VTHAAWLLPLVPLVSAVVGLLLSGRAPGHRPTEPAARVVAGGGALLSWVLALLLWRAAPRAGAAAVETVVRLTPTGSVPVAAGTRVDGLGATVALMVATVALVVQVYSMGYLRGGPRYPSYAALVSLFTAAMLLVVLAADLIELLVGWEVMGICSYFLVGHYWEQRYAQDAAVKAFLVTRLGDVGFLFGIFVLGRGAGSFRITEIVAAVPHLSPATLTAGTLLLLCGVAGKSAQFPLQVWLPDAMAGPTPVSALIHAATMVAAGVYLVALLYPVFLAAPATLAVLAVLACVTMLGAALVALAQDDVKRVLAWSTISQLAYMLAGLSVGGRDAAAFHLLTHAAFKALLFLGAGSLIHAHGTNSLGAMGGLWRAMPVTFVTMTVGLGALAGVPPLSGFVSKEAILAAAERTAGGHGAGSVAGWAGLLVLLVGLLTAGVTAMYAGRLWLLAFLGDRRGSGPAHEPGALMWVPLVVLAVPAAGLGWFARAADRLPSWVGVTATPQAFGLDPLTTGLSVVAVGLGLLAVTTLWGRREYDDAPHGADPAAALGLLDSAYTRGFGVDAAYVATVVRPVQALARVVRVVDERVVDGYVRGAGSGARAAGRGLRLAQNGNVQTYLSMLLAGVVALAVSVAVAFG